MAFYQEEIEIRVLASLLIPEFRQHIPEWKVEFPETGCYILKSILYFPERPVTKSSPVDPGST